MVEIEIDGKAVEVQQGSMVMDAAKKLGGHIPHFCYHKKLSIAANCRMCLVEVEKAPKPLPACATPVTPGMKVHTHSEKAVQAQKSVMEFLLINPYWDASLTGLSLVGTYWASKRRIENWVLWIFVDCAYVAMYLVNGLWMTAGLYFVFVLMAIRGWIQWRNELKIN